MILLAYFAFTRSIHTGETCLFVKVPFFRRSMKTVGVISISRGCSPVVWIDIHLCEVRHQVQ
jgi:hypothetical protein